jgi:DNA polymerase III epsilon subunit-like protein
MTRPQIIIDTETTALVPDYGDGYGTIWELALIERDSGAERLYRLEPDVDRADEQALTVGRFRERTKGMGYADAVPAGHGEVWDLTKASELLWSDPGDLAPHIAGLLDGATLIAANPTFDAGFLSAFLAAYGCRPAPWHYRLRDIGSMAWAWLSGRNTHEYAGCTGRYDLPPMDASTDDFARALGIDPEKFDRHTALGDCRLVAAMLDVMEGGAP